MPLRHAIMAGRCTAHAAARTAGELARGFGRPSDDPGDVIEGHIEHVVQHECNALGRRQRIEQNQEGQADRVGEHGFFLRAFAGSAVAMS